MEKDSDFKSMYYDILWWLKTRCTDWAINPASVDWSHTDTLMYESYQFEELLEYFTEQQGWSPSLMIARKYHMEVTFNDQDQVIDIRNLNSGYHLPMVRVHFNTSYGAVNLSYHDTDSKQETRWDIEFND